MTYVKRIILLATLAAVAMMAVATLVSIGYFAAGFIALNGQWIALGLLGWVLGSAGTFAMLSANRIAHDELH